MEQLINISDLSDETLHRLALSGNMEAEEQLVKRYSRLVRACARPYFLAGGDSEDLIQEGMLGLLSALREYNLDGGASFRTYAELCIRRRLYSAIKSAAGSKHAPLNNYVSLESPAFDGNRTNTDSKLRAVFRREPEDLLIDKERSDEILSDFAVHLSGLEAEILGLYLQGLSYREISNKIDKPLKSVDNAVQRVRRKLAQINHGDISFG